MSILWFVAGFILCLFMPASIQMVAKNLVSGLYNKIRNLLGKEDTRDIRY